MHINLHVFKIIAEIGSNHNEYLEECKKTDVVVKISWL